MKKIVLTLTTIFTVLMLMVSIPLYTFAVSQSDKDALQDKINNAKSELKNIQNSQRDAKSELENLTIQVMDAENELDSLKAELSELESSIETKESEITEKQAEIKRKEKLLQERIVALYEAGDSTYLDVLLGSDSLLDFLSKYEIVQQIVDADTALITDLDNDKKSLENEKAELETSKAKVKELKDQQEIKSNELKILKKNKQSEVDKYNTAMEEVNRQLSEIEKDAQERLDRDGVKFDGSFIWPCNNKYVTSRMKWRWGRWHKGIDIGARYENVYASASGYAYNATNPGGYGTYIMIFHGDGYATLYGHLNSSHIRNGQYVSQGQVIATSGNSGGSTGAHLHFEIRHSTSISNFFGNNWLNPLDYLPGGYTILD